MQIIGNKDLIKKLMNKYNMPIVRNIAILTSGTLLAQVISVIASPFITRIFLPDVFGYLFYT